MPQIESWSQLPQGIRDHLVDRMRDRKITVQDLNQLRLWIESRPDVPDGPWYKDFGSFKLCGEGKFPKTFLLLNPRWARNCNEKPVLLVIPSRPQARSAERARNVHLQTTSHPCHSEER